MQVCIGNIKIDWKQKVHWKQSYELGYTEISPRFPKNFCSGPAEVWKFKLVLVRVCPFFTYLVLVQARTIHVFLHFQNAGRQGATRETITGAHSLIKRCVLIYQSLYMGGRSPQKLMGVRFSRSPTKVLNGQSIDRSFGPGPSRGRSININSVKDWRNVLKFSI